MLQTGSGGLPVSGLESSTFSQTTDPLRPHLCTCGLECSWPSYGDQPWYRLDRESSLSWTSKTDTVRESLGNVSRQFGPKLTGHVQGSYSRTDFGQVYHELVGDIGLTWNLGRRTFLDLRPNITASIWIPSRTRVQERRVWLRFGYGVSALRSQGPVRVQ